MTAEPVASICHRIAARAADMPNRPAVSDGAACLTYADLEVRSGRLASFLRDSGAARETCVALLLDRSVDFVVAALAVLKSGAAYLPMDPATPTDRAMFIVKDSGASFLLTHKKMGPRVPSGPWRSIELDGADASRISACRPLDANEPDGDSLANVIYTSGSAGRPKGVEITHANLLNLIDWHVSAFGTSPADRASQLAGVGFDAAGWEIWPALTAGASLHIADELTRRSPRALRDWLVAQKITISFVPTVLAEQLLHLPWPAETALQTLLTGADTLHRRPSMDLPFVLVNNYGPTECTVVATSGRVVSQAPDGAPPSIGRPIANAKVFILDDELHPVAAGEAGELCLAGALVGRGYRDLPELTASRFVMFKPDSGPPLRIYRTGDRARRLDNGEIAFLGRLDEQVKVRGYRIELGEIITCLDQHPGVEASTVTLRQGAGPEGAGEPASLVAYVILADTGHVTATDLREFLARRLPDYMVPAQFVAMPALPMNANGKLDRAALPVPGADNLLPDRTPVVAAAAAHQTGTGLEQRIGSMVALLLGQPSIEPDADFFMAGGHSMLGAQLVAKIRETFNVKLTLRQLFGAPTVAALSAEVARLTSAAAGGDAVNPEKAHAPANSSIN